MEPPDQLTMRASATYRRLAEPSQEMRRPSNCTSCTDASAEVGGGILWQLHERLHRATPVLLLHLVDIELGLRSASVPEVEIVRVDVRAAGRTLPPDRRVLVPVVEQPVTLIAHPIGIEQGLADGRDIESQVGGRLATCRDRLRLTWRGSDDGWFGRLGRFRRFSYGRGDRERYRRRARHGWRFRLRRSGSRKDGLRRLWRIRDPQRCRCRTGYAWCGWRFRPRRSGSGNDGLKRLGRVSDPQRRRSRTGGWTRRTRRPGRFLGSHGRGRRTGRLRAPAYSTYRCRGLRLRTSGCGSRRCRPDR